MKWVNVNSGTSNENFELWDNDIKLAGASFNNTSRIVRIASAAGRRLFFYGKKGWLAPKSVIKNEYGITLGKVEPQSETGEKGFVELDGKKYRYHLSEGEQPKLELFEGEQLINVTSCNFTSVISRGIKKTSSLMDTRFPQLLLLLCWYSFNLHNSGTQQPAAAIRY